FKFQLVSGTLLIYRNQQPGAPGPVVATNSNLNDAITAAEEHARRTSSPKRANIVGGMIIFAATFNNNEQHRVGWIPPQ
ncbi:hypothetical protein Mgra_00002543, partial [Meloidogyne graminicola]